MLNWVSVSCCCLSRSSFSDGDGGSVGRAADGLQDQGQQHGLIYGFVMQTVGLLYYTLLGKSITFLWLLLLLNNYRWNKSQCLTILCALSVANKERKRFFVRKLGRAVWWDKPYLPLLLLPRSQSIYFCRNLLPVNINLFCLSVSLLRFPSDRHGHGHGHGDGHAFGHRCSSCPARQALWHGRAFKDLASVWHRAPEAHTDAWKGQRQQPFQRPGQFCR